MACASRRGIRYFIRIKIAHFPHENQQRSVGAIRPRTIGNWNLNQEIGK